MIFIAYKIYLHCKSYLISGEANLSVNRSGNFWNPAYLNSNTGMASPVGPSSPNYQDFSPILKKMSYQVSTAMPENDIIMKQNTTEAMDQTQAVSTSPQGSNSMISSVTSPTSFSPAASAGMISGGAHKQSIGSPNYAANKLSTDSICRSLGIDSIQLVSWMENLRMWISQTILERIVKEIKETNELLIQHGMAEEQIGKISIDKLRKVASLPHILERVPSLDALLPFLEITNQQEYLVKRLKELSEGGAMSDYKWNGGGRYKGVVWSDKLPTDAEIVMNCVAAYLDGRMPKHYHYTSNVDGKPFSGIYFLKTLNSDLQKNGSNDKTEKLSDPKAQKMSFFATLLASTKSSNVPVTKEADIANASSTSSQQHKNFVIVQIAQKPPHYVLQLNSRNNSSNSIAAASSSANVSIKDGETLDVGQGRNNLFHVLLLFLHLIKTKEQGMLGRINFGSSGINVLWVLDEQ